MDDTALPGSGAPTPLGRRLVPVVLMAGAAMLAMGGGLIVGAAGPRGAGVAAWVGLSCALTSFVGLMLRSSHGRGAFIIVAGAQAALLLPAWFMAQTSWSAPIVSAGWRCGTGDLGLLMLGLPTSLILTVVGAGAGERLGRMHRSRWAKLAGRARWFAVVVTALGGATLVTSVGRPTATAWPEALPTTKTLRFAPEEGQAGAVVRHALGDGAVLERRCRERAWDGAVECGVRVGMAPLPACDDPELCADEGLHRVAPEDVLVVRRDAHLAAWSVDAAEGASRTMVFGAGGPRTVAPPDLGATVAPPPPFGWLFGFGAFAVVALQAWRRRVQITREAARAGRVGISDGHDVRFFDGELPAHAELASEVEPGPVVVLESSADVRRASYRDDGQAGHWRALAGDRESVLTELAHTMAGLDACTVVVALVASLPLLVASALW